MTGITCVICGQSNASQARNYGIYCATCYSRYVLTSPAKQGILVM